MSAVVNLVMIPQVTLVLILQVTLHGVDTTGNSGVGKVSIDSRDIEVLDDCGVIGSTVGCISECHYNKWP